MMTRSLNLRLIRPVTLAFALTALAGCSAVPDAVNPAEWYNNTVDFFSGEDDKGQVAAQDNPGEGQPFPNLASAPKKTENAANQGLVADVEGRKYAQSIARQGEAPDNAMAKAAPVQPTPPAQPAISVTQVPVPVQAQMKAQPAEAPATIMAAQQPAQQVAALAPTMPANSMTPAGDDPYATVIVSSNGIEMNGATVSMPEKPVAASTAGAEATPTPTLQRFLAADSGGTRIATILFGNGSAALDNQDRKILSEVVLLQKERGGKVRIVGHSSSRTRNMDPVKHAMVNYKLSVNRANKIATALIRQGMPAEVLMVDSRSDALPMYSEDMPSGEAGNRRAEVYFVN